jgi:exopolysaccharide biosynthesis protein YbjH
MMGTAQKNIILSFVMVIIVCTVTFAQSVIGVTGYVRIPTAQFNDDKSIVFGTSFLPKKYLDYTKREYDAIAVYTTLTFLPFLEVNFRLSSYLGYHEYTIDRMPSIRLQLLKERKWYPSVVIGIHDFGDAMNFSSSYIVCTRTFNIENTGLQLQGTIGYGTKKLLEENNEFIGLFGGASVMWDRLKFIQLMCDYDGITINPGIRTTILKRLNVLVGLQGGVVFTGTVSYGLFLK